MHILLDLDLKILISNPYIAGYDENVYQKVETKIT